MNNEELEKYLNSLILCIEYYYRYKLFVYVRKIPKTSKVSFIKEEEINKTFYFTPQNNRWNYIKKHLHNLYISKDAIDYFIKNLQLILKEYLQKNNLDFIEINYIAGTNPLIDGLANILIQTETETFLLAIRAD